MAVITSARPDSTQLNWSAEWPQCPTPGDLSRVGQCDHGLTDRLLFCWSQAAYTVNSLSTVNSCTRHRPYHTMMYCWQCLSQNLQLSTTKKNDSDREDTRGTIQWCIADSVWVKTYSCRQRRKMTVTARIHEMTTTDTAIATAGIPASAALVTAFMAVTCSQSRSQNK